MDKKLRILVVDDEMIVRESFYHWFKKAGYGIDAAASGAEALDKLERVSFDVLFVDIKMPGMSGMELLRTAKEIYPDTIVVIITAFGTIESAVEAMKLGAADYLLKPFKPDQLTLVMEKLAQQKKLTSECDYLKERLNRLTRFENIIGRSRAMEEIFRLIPEVAPSDASILITGETGTGKELVAKAIHAKSARSPNPFIAFNCGAVTDTLLESELFGHVKGAFTGALQSRRGLLEVISGGTLFLDEIGEISQKMQIDLLRVLDEKQIQRVGSLQQVPVDFRLVSATCRDLDALIHKGAFREDFFYRINVIMLHLPPLRERGEDVSLLLTHFMEKYSREMNKAVDRLDPGALRLLEGYAWPGNVRELENAVERAVVLAKSRTLKADDFSFLTPGLKAPAKPVTLKQKETDYIREILDASDGNVSKAAEVLGIHRVTLHKKMKRLEMVGRGRRRG